MGLKWNNIFFKDTSRNRWILAGVTAGIVALLLSPSFRILRVHYRVGEVADRNIKSPAELLLEDRPATEKKKDEAEQRVLSVFDYDVGLRETVEQRVREMMRTGRKRLGEGSPGGESGEFESTLKKELEEVVGVEIQPEEFQRLRIRKFSSRRESELVELIGGVLGEKIVSSRDLLLKERDRGVTLRTIERREGKGGKEEGTPASSSPPEEILSGGEIALVLDVGEARSILSRKARVVLGKLPAWERYYFANLAQRLILPNLTFNRSETEARRAGARDGVKPVLFKIKAGEMILREGEVVRDDHILKLQAIRLEQKYANFIQITIGIFGLAFLMIVFLHRFGQRNIRKFEISLLDLVFLSIALVGSLVLERFFLALITSAGGVFGYIPRSAFYFFLPVASITILVRMLLNSETALLFAFVLSPLSGILLENELFYTLYFLIGGLVGADGVRRCEQRITLVKTGAWLGLVNVGMIIVYRLLGGGNIGAEILIECGLGFTGGVVGTVLVTGIIPLFEYLFGYTTDIQLLELSNLEHPLLKDLAVRAPGTYHHSVVIGSMVEDAAKAIGANPLLARVAAYYHDVGKFPKSMYFIENQKNGMNPHDRLNPRLSALILISHVKEGIALARKYRLPRPIIEIIAQHHGTGLIKYFYEKAQGLAKPEHREVEEKDYRYPGPPPQSREGGLVLLADVVEASSRTLSDPSPSRLQGMVQKTINGIFSGGQLDNCMLTLRDLHEIAKSFNRVLSGIYHQRIDYPEPVAKGNVTFKDEDTDRNRREKESGKPKEDKKSGQEDLRRLGLS